MKYNGYDTTFSFTRADCVGDTGYGDPIAGKLSKSWSVADDLFRDIPHFGETTSSAQSSSSSANPSRSWPMFYLWAQVRIIDANICASELHR
jgi:hypothetical protein